MKKYGILFLAILGVLSCSAPSGEIPSYATESLIYPDYTEVTIPRGIAPLTFHVNTEEKEVRVVLRSGDYSVTMDKKEVAVSATEWKKLMSGSDTIRVDILSKKDQKVLHAFSIYISEDAIDPYLSYRLIAPGHELWGQMGIYQRSLADYEEKAIYENTHSKQVCVNCHTSNQGNPDESFFHQRPKPSGTILVKDGKVQKLSNYFSEKVPILVYPSWHPSGEYIAFSVNKTVQSIHSLDKNRIEVMDLWSDIVVLELKTNQLLTSTRLMLPEAFETFPSFSPDGKRLYFCTAKAVTLPDSIKSVKYDLCAIDFDAVKETFGQQVDTIVKASEEDCSVSFPRVSPDGRFLLYTKHAYGNFSIWHREADLHMYDLQKQQSVDVNLLNSSESESFHSWSSNGRWVVFSSRRNDGLYTSLYLAHIDETGKVGKPFILPQKQSGFYFYQDKSYNVPEFMKGEMKDFGPEFQKLIAGDKTLRK